MGGRILWKGGRYKMIVEDVWTLLLPNLPHDDPPPRAIHVWRRVLTPDEAKLAAKAYLAGLAEGERVGVVKGEEEFRVKFRQLLQI